MKTIESFFKFIDILEVNGCDNNGSVEKFGELRKYLINYYRERESKV